jgi:integrase
VDNFFAPEFQKIYNKASKGVRIVRRANGTGSITILKGKRRKKYWARITTGYTFDPEKETVKQIRESLGTFKTLLEAEMALNQYLDGPYEISDKNLSMKELFDRWYSYHVDTEAWSKSYQRIILSSWAYCHAIFKVKVRDIRIRHIKGCMNDGFVIVKRGKEKGTKKLPSANVKSRIKSLFNQMLAFAAEYEVITVNYAKNFTLSKELLKDIEENREKHIPFQPSEIKRLWDNQGDYFVEMMLIDIYSGWRPSELISLDISQIFVKDGYMIGGMKTEAGKDRIVPIHPIIRPLIKKYYDFAKNAGRQTLFFDIANQRPLSYDQYYRRFKSRCLFLDLNQEHTPHDGRVSFATYAKSNGIDEYALKYLLGHSIQDLTEKVYTERELPWLVKEMEKLTIELKENKNDPVWIEEMIG